MKYIAAAFRIALEQARAADIAADMPTFRLHPIATCSSWVKPIEQRFAELT